MNLLALSTAMSLSLLGSLPSEDIVSDDVDLVEINHYYDDNARHVFDQIIFYDWCDEERRFQVRAWRLIRSPSQLPARNWATGEYEVLWNDGTVMRRVHAKAMRETWTQHDPELRERDYLPKDRRREFVIPRSTSTAASP